MVPEPALPTTGFVNEFRPGLVGSVPVGECAGAAVII